MESSLFDDEGDMPPTGEVHSLEDGENLIDFANSFFVDDTDSLEMDENEITIDESLVYTLPVRKNTFLKEWIFMSSMFFDSTEIFGQNTVFSLRHLPSDDRKSGPFLMAANLQSMILGTTVLGLPFCIKIAGVWSIFAILLVGMAVSFSAAVIGDCQYQTSISKPGESKRVHISFVQMAKQCMHDVGSVVMKALVYLSLLRNVVMIILLTDLTKAILAELDFTDYDSKVIAVLWTCASIPLMFITNITCLVWVGFIGLLLYMCAIVGILAVTITEYKSWDISTISWDFDVDKFGIALGIVINSYSVHMNLPSLEGSLKNPRHYKPASNVTFALNNILKIAFALCGYLTYTDTTQQVIIVNTTSYRPLPTMFRAAVIFFSFFTLPMQCHIPFELLDSTLKKRFSALGKFSWLLLSRSVFMTLALLISVLVPHFGIVVSLIGSIRGSIITLILPCSFYVMLRTHEIKFYKMVISYGIIGIGLASGILGFYASVKALVTGVQL